jgi:tetratricopeptide (TPR) repeat protein
MMAYATSFRLLLHLFFKKMFKNTIVIVLLSLGCMQLMAQNTIGGKKVSVPEEEVERQSQFLTAERERMLGHWDKALDAYRKFTYDNPDADAAWYGLARTYTALKELDKAIDAIGKAILHAPDNQWYMIYQADLYEQLGRSKDAVKTYEALIKKMPENTDFLEKLAYLYVRSEDPKNALKTLTKLESLVGISEDNIAKKHLIYVGLGDLKKAADEYRRLADAYPKEPKYLYQLADFYARIGDQANERRTYEEILKRNPNDANARFAVAGTAKNNGSDIEKLKAMKPLFADNRVSIDQKIQEIVPFFEKLDKNPDPQLAIILTELGTIIESTHPDEAKAWSLSGDLFYYTNQADAALIRYRRCIQLSPRVFSVWENTLDILAAQKQFSEMLKTSENAIDAFPNQPKAYYYAAVANLSLNQPAAALSYADQGLPMTGKNPVLRAQLLDLRGTALLAQKKYPEAIKVYENALSIANQEPTLLEHYGDALFLNGQPDAAIEQWKKANSIRPTPQLEQKINVK